MSTYITQSLSESALSENARNHAEAKRMLDEVRAFCKKNNVALFATTSSIDSRDKEGANCRSYHHVAAGHAKSVTGCAKTGFAFWTDAVFQRKLDKVLPDADVDAASSNMPTPVAQTKPPHPEKKEYTSTLIVDEIVELFEAGMVYLVMEDGKPSLRDRRTFIEPGKKFTEMDVKILYNWMNRNSSRVLLNTQTRKKYEPDDAPTASTTPMPYQFG